MMTKKQVKENQEKSSSSSTQKDESSKELLTTRVIVKYDVGYPNTIYIRGKGANLSWDKGILLKNTKPDEWIWEIQEIFKLGEFKVTINDIEFELGENHPLNYGATIQYTPKF